MRTRASTCRYAALALLGLTALPTACAPNKDARPPKEMRVLFLFAEFPDLAWSEPRAGFTGDGGYVSRMQQYFDEVSYGQFRVVPVLSDRLYSLSRPRATYLGKPAALVKDTFALATRPEGEREQLARTKIDTVVVFFAGVGKESHTASGPEDLWSNFCLVRPALVTPSGGTIERACVIAERERPPFSPFGVLCHEFGHLLGLPELYVTRGLPHEGIGVWGLMGQGTWLDRGRTPPHLSAWSKVRLGWVTPRLVHRTEPGVALRAVEDAPEVIKIWARGPEAAHEYFLIENRRRTGFDRFLPGQGLLIWHVDESVRGFRTAQNDPEHKLLDLEAADGLPCDLDKGHRRGGNRGDARDPWAQSPDGFGPTSEPSSAPYDGSPGRFAVRNIGPSGPVMSFDLSVEAFAGKDTAADTVPPARAAAARF